MGLRAAVSDRTLLFIHASARIGGTELQTLEITRWLRERGFNVIALFDCQPGPVLDRYREEGFPYLHSLSGLWPSRAVREWIAAAGPRAALLHGLKVNLKWRLWLKLLFPGVRRWGAIRGLTNSSSVGWHRIFLDRLTLPLLDGYVTNSRFVADYLSRREFPLSKIYYLKNFVRPGNRIPDDNKSLVIQRKTGGGAPAVLPGPVPVIIYVANVRPVKGHDLLVPVLSLLKRGGARFLCVLVGDLPRDSLVPALVKQAELEEEVVFAGLRDDVDAILQRSDVFVFPSLMESCPNAVLEAMRAGLPIVASPWGDQAWLVEEGQGGFVVDPSDTDLFAGRIQFLLLHSAERHRFGEHNRRRLAETFVKAEIEAATLALFTRMAE